MPPGRLASMRPSASVRSMSERQNESSASARSTCTTRVVPPPRTVNAYVSPGDTASTALRSSAVSSICVPSIAVTTSPTSTPARSAGDPAKTASTTSTPPISVSAVPSSRSMPRASSSARSSGGSDSGGPPNGSTPPPRMLPISAASAASSDSGEGVPGVSATGGAAVATGVAAGPDDVAATSVGTSAASSPVQADAIASSQRVAVSVIAERAGMSWIPTVRSRPRRKRDECPLHVETRTCHTYIIRRCMRNECPCGEYAGRRGQPALNVRRGVDCSR